MTARERIITDDREKNEPTENLINEDVADVRVQSNSFCWQDISVWGKQKEAHGLWRRTSYRNFEMVKKASGFVPHGSLLAVMGPSGCGKTTLLVAISRRLREGVQGNVYMNGKTVNAEQMLAISGFVPQDDLTIQSLTVYEHFKIMAALKMDRNTSHSHRMRKILSLMEEIGIKNLATSYLSDLSGGERRKLSIAVELLTDPLLLFCDEPTTGLDSANAAVVIKMLKKFSSKGKIVICSIHQPAALIYELFNQVLLLAIGGRVAYFGPVMQASNYFKNLGFTCPSNYNIAEFLINNVSLSDFDADERIGILCGHYSASTLKRELEERIAFTFSYNQISESPLKDQTASLVTKKFIAKKPTLITQTRILLLRSCLSFRKDYATISLHILSLVYVSAMITTLFSEVTLCSESSVQNIRGALNNLVVFTWYESAYYQFNTLVSERHFVMREINNGVYSIGAYSIAKLITKLTLAVFESIIVVLVLQSISKFCSHLSFWNLVLPFVLTIIVATAYGCMLSSAFNNLNILFVVAMGYEMPAYLLSGITVNLSTLPTILSYFRYLSLLYYPVEYIFVLEWKRALTLHIQCEDHLPNGIITRSNKIREALHLLAENGYDVRYYQKNVWILILISIVLFTVTHGFLRRRSKERVPY